MTSQLIKKMKYADAWELPDICNLLATYNQNIGDYRFFDDLIKKAEESRIFKTINDSSITAHSLNPHSKGPIPNKLYTRPEIQDWVHHKGFVLPDELTQIFETSGGKPVNWKERCMEEMEISKEKDRKIEQLEGKLENSFLLLEKDDPFYSSELNTAIVLQGKIKKEFTENLPATSEMANIVKKQFASEKLSNAASSRIATVVNPDANKDGGRKPPKLPVKNMSGSLTV